MPLLRGNAVFVRRLRNKPISNVVARAEFVGHRRAVVKGTRTGAATRTLR